jgi:spore coat polysaccharide biosynthesis predicted glycosyltransferase SpsG/L-amino acid N-acyltransferase YncA
MKVKIFTEAGRGIGLGHFSRCSALYDEIVSRNIKVDLIVYGDIENTPCYLKKGIVNINWICKDYIDKNIKSTDYCIIDSYLAPVELYEMISTRAGKCIFLDDNGRINYPKGIVVNPSLDISNIQYVSEEYLEYIYGPQYIITRHAFLDVPNKVIRDKVIKVLVTIGGSDPRGLTKPIIENICKRYPHIEFNIIVTSSFRDAVDFKNICKDNMYIYYDIDAEQMKNMMIDTDIAITGAGQTMYELLTVKTPFVAIKVVQNQENNILGIKRYDMEIPLLDAQSPGIIKEIEVAFKQMFSYEARRKCVNTYRNYFDGRGAMRIVDKLLNDSSGLDNLYVREAILEDSYNALELSNKDYVREYSMHKNKIAWGEHITWFKEVLQNADIFLYIIEDNSEKLLGQVRYNINNKKATISISVKREAGKGVGTFLFKESMSKLSKERKDIQQIDAFILEKNIVSIRFFNKLGFSLIEEKDGVLKYSYDLGGKDETKRNAE